MKLLKEWLPSGLCCVVVFLSPTTIAIAQAPLSDSSYVIATNANLRTGPGTQFESLGLVTIGTPVSILETKSGWAKVELTDQSWFSLDIKGWLRDDLISDAKPTAVEIRNKLESLPTENSDERQKWAERLAVVDGGTIRRDSSRDLLAKILEAKGQQLEASKVRKDGPQVSFSLVPHFDTAKFQERKNRSILAMPKVLLRQAPSDKAVPVPFSGKPLELGNGETAQVIEVVVGSDGREWARIGTFRRMSDRLVLSGWVLNDGVRHARPYLQVKQWSGPQVVSASVGDWGGIYFFDNDGSVYDSKGKGQLWRLDDYWIGEMPESIEYFGVKNNQLCMYSFCSTTIGRFLAANGKAASNEKQALLIAKSTVVTLFKRGKFPELSSVPKVLLSWQPKSGVYVFELGIYPIENKSIEVVVWASGEAAAFSTIDTDPK